MQDLVRAEPGQTDLSFLQAQAEALRSTGFQLHKEATRELIMQVCFGCETVAHNCDAVIAGGTCTVGVWRTGNHREMKFVRCKQPAPQACVAG
jgi:hypothetical protein